MDDADELTVHSLELVDDFSKSHLVTRDMALESRENSSAQFEFFVQISLCPSVVIQLQLWGDIGIEVGAKDT
jgi:hypothetical protein